MTRKQQTVPDAPGRRDMPMAQAFQIVLDLATKQSVLNLHDEGQHQRVEQESKALELLRALAVGSFSLED